MRFFFPLHTSWSHVAWVQVGWCLFDALPTIVEGHRESLFCCSFTAFVELQNSFSSLAENQFLLVLTPQWGQDEVESSLASHPEIGTCCFFKSIFPHILNITQFLGFLFLIWEVWEKIRIHNNFETWVRAAGMMTMIKIADVVSSAEVGWKWYLGFSFLTYWLGDICISQRSSKESKSTLKSAEQTPSFLSLFVSVSQSACVWCMCMCLCVCLGVHMFVWIKGQCKDLNYSPTFNLILLHWCGSWDRPVLAPGLGLPSSTLHPVVHMWKGWGLLSSITKGIKTLPHIWYWLFTASDELLNNIFKNSSAKLY